MATIDELENRENNTQSINSKTVYEDSTDFKRMLEELSEGKVVTISQVNSDGKGIVFSIDEPTYEKDDSFFGKLKASLGNFYNFLEAVAFFIATFLSGWFLNYLLTDSSVTHIKVGLFLLPILFAVKGFKSLWAFLRGLAGNEEDF